MERNRVFGIDGTSGDKPFDLPGTENLFPCVSYYIRDSIGAATSCRLPSGTEIEEIYLEGKVLELLSLFCDEVVGKQSGDKEISREDYRCLQKAREMIDHHFLHPLTIQQIAPGVFFERNKLKQGFKTCFNCTVYEYIVEKRMEMAYRLLQKERYKVKDVVWMVGLQQYKSLHRGVRKRYGITPGEL